MRKLALSLVLIATLPFMSACVAFVAGAAATGMVVSDNRSMHQIKEDQAIRHQLSLNIARDPEFKDSNISVAALVGTVLLSGQTPFDAGRAKAERYAHSTPGVKRVFNELTVGENSSASVKTKDAWITTKLRTLMMAEKGLKSGTIKVVTENKVVYLMGYVSHYQADLAVDVASSVKGVKKVVKLFEYKTTELS